MHLQELELKQKLAIIGMLGIVLSACQPLRLIGLRTVTGSGVAASETRTVAGFNQIELSGVGEVIVEVGAEPSLVVEADDNLIPLLTSRVDNKTLVLGTQQNTMINTRSPIRFRVTVPNLEAALLSGSGDMAASGIKSNSFRCEVSGSGAVTLSGVVGSLAAEITGSGTLHAGELKSEHAEVSTAGSGAATVWATQSLNVEISGSGSTQYFGTPKVKRSISGSGAITDLGEK